MAKWRVGISGLHEPGAPFFGGGWAVTEMQRGLQ